MSLFSFLLLMSISWAKSGYGVGNGGQGLLLGDRVVLRDLYEANLHSSPFFGSKMDSDIRRSAQSFPMEVSEAFLNRLAVKITDLRQADPRLGEIFLSAAKMYSWQMIPGSLLPISDAEGDLVPFPEGSRLVQVASRLGGTIRVSRPLWEKMDAENQVALVLHEIAYALVWTNIRDNRESQSAIRTREIVGYFFSAEWATRGPVLFQNQVRGNLAVRWDEIPLEQTSLRGWDLEFGKGQNLVRKRVSVEDLSDRDAFAELASIVHAFCQDALNLQQKGLDRVQVRSRLRLRNFKFEYVYYRLPGGTQQKALSVSPLVEGRDLMTETDASNCEASLQAPASLMYLQL